MSLTINLINLICLAYFVVLINPLGWHMIIHIAPLYLPFIFKNLNRIHLTNPKPVLFMFLFFSYTLFSCIFISNGNGTFDKLIRYFYELILIAIFFNIIIPPKTIALLNKFYILSCLAIVLKMAFQRISLPEDETRYTIFNFIKLMDPNFLTGLFVLPCIILFYRIIHYKQPKKDMLLLGILLLAILATGSRGGLLAVLLGCGIILMKDASLKWKITMIILGISTFAVLSYFSVENLSRFTAEGLEDGSNILRFHLWGVSWDIFMSNPLFGRGANSMINLGMQYGARINIMVHNTFLEILTDYGILGFLLWSGVYLSILKRSIHLKNVLTNSILISTAFCAFFISAQDSAFWWQNIILCNAMLSYQPRDVIDFNYKLHFSNK